MTSKPCYTPGSYLTFLTPKVMEHIVCCHISPGLSANFMVSPNHFGFQRGLSCETQLYTVINEWSSVLNVHRQVDAVFLDLARATTQFLRLTATKFTAEKALGHYPFLSCFLYGICKYPSISTHKHLVFQGFSLLSLPLHPPSPPRQ